MTIRTRFYNRSVELLKNFLLLLLLVLFSAALLLFPADGADAARAGLRLCFQTVLPSLFPFFVLSSLVVSSGAAQFLSRLLAPLMRPLFGLSGSGAGVLALGFLGGYPVGARTAAELFRAGTLSRDEAERLLSFCNNAGPGFILGICGSALFHSARAGLCLWLIHALTAIFSGFLICHIHPINPVHSNMSHSSSNSSSHNGPFHQDSTKKSLLRVFPGAVRESFFAVWAVCGFVVIFAVLLRFLTLVLPWFAESSILRGSVELTNGILSLTPDRNGFVACAMLLAWGGWSVHAQTLSVLDESELSPRLYFPGKLLQLLLTLPLALLLSNCVV